MDKMKFPRMALIRQDLYREEITDVRQSVIEAVHKLNIRGKIYPGMRVAVTAGSRGIDRIDEVIKAVIDILKEWGAHPFIYPAMGSHGGAMPEGQVSILRHYGITEETMDVPILSSMDVVKIGVTPRGVPVFLDKFAYEADALIVVNRIKTHTKFDGQIESGLFKMMAIGMGKHKGASVYHRAAVDHGMEAIIVDAGEMILKKCSVLFGLGIVENGVDRITRIKALHPDEMLEGEKELLRFSKGVMAKIPFDNLDLLIIDEIGKNISGTGMDTKVIGRHRDLIGDFWIHPHPKRIFVRDLTEASEGNATGVGLADFTTRRCIEKIDIRKTAVNCITALSPEKAALPLSFPTDREAIEAALQTVGIKPVSMLRIAQIINTLALEIISVSEGLEGDVMGDLRVQKLTDYEEMKFDDAGSLVSLF
jgi:uncharacterized protein (DUF362 family)